MVVGLEIVPPLAEEGLEVLVEVDYRTLAAVAGMEGCSPLLLFLKVAQHILQLGPDQGLD